MFNLLIDGVPTTYKGHDLNTDFRVALRIQELLDDPILLTCSNVEKAAAYKVAASLLFKEPVTNMGFDFIISALNWWLSCGKDDKVINYWRETGIMPDIDNNSFDLKEYEAPKSDIISIDTTDINGNTVIRDVTRYSILSFNAPDGTIRYAKKSNGDPDLISLFEDAEIIYSGFYKIYNIDLATAALHWFTFCYLLSELECDENTALYHKISIRAFDPSQYKGKQNTELRNKMNQQKSKNRVLGILPYIDRGDTSG